MRLMRLLRCVLILPFLCTLAISEVRAQGFFSPNGLASGRFLEPPRSIQQQIREAERSIENESYADAVVGLGQILERESRELDDRNELLGQDFFLDAGESGNNTHHATESLIRRAREMIGNLPPKAMALYQDRYDAIAQKMLQDAAATRDWSVVETVRRKYFHTSAGADASLLLARRNLYEGHPLAASLLLDDVVRSKTAMDRLGQEVAILHAGACRMAGRELPPDLLSADPVEKADKPDKDGEPKFSVGKAISRSGANYLISGGTPDRNGDGGGEMPLTNERWLLDVTSSPRQTRTLSEAAGEFAASGNLPPPSWTPVLVGDFLIMRTTERVVGVDYRTGKRVWMHPWATDVTELDSGAMAFDEIETEDQASVLLTQRVWNDLPYGEMSSDGENIYFIDNLNAVTMATYNPLIGMRGTRPNDSGSNTLVSLELKTEGKMNWRIGKNGDVTSTLTDAFFLGAPLPLEGRLYAIVEIAGDVILVCLDPRDGSEVWRQNLVAVETGRVELDPVRRVAGASPTYHEGVLICPTGAGATVAVDLVDRSLRWGVTYARNNEMMRSMVQRSRSIDRTQLMRRWHSGGAIASGQSVLITPIETDRLFAFDLVSGKQLFTEKNRILMRYVAGIRDDQFYLVGNNQMSAYDLRSGKNLWTTGPELLVPGQIISGRGVFTEASYLLPTTSNELIEVSLKDGTVMQRRELRYELGNLIAAGGELISQGATTLSVAYGENSLAPKIDELLKINPENTDAIVRKAELLIENGQRDEAIELLAKAIEREPDNTEAIKLSVSAMLDKLRQQPTIDESVVTTLDQLIYQPEQRVELQAIRIRAAIESNKYEEATRVLIELSSLISNDPTVKKAADRIVSEPSRSCSLDAWIAGRAYELASTTSKDQLAAVNEMVRAHAKKLLDLPSGMLAQALTHFAPLEGSEELREELASRYLSNREWLSAWGTELGSRVPTDEALAELAPERLLELAKINASTRFYLEADRMISLLKSRKDFDGGEALDELVKQLGSVQEPMKWSETAEMNWQPRPERTRAGIVSTAMVAETKVVAGDQFRGWRLVSEDAYAMALRDTRGYPRGIPIQTQDQQREVSQNEAKIVGGVMVVVTPNAMLGIDLHRLEEQTEDPLLWRHGFSSDETAALRRRSNPTRFGDQVFQFTMIAGEVARSVPKFSLGPILGDRVLALQGGDLICLDLRTGETLWHTLGAPTSGEVLVQGDEVAVVSDEEKRLVFYNLHDGRKVRETVWTQGQIWWGEANHVLTYASTEVERQYQVRLINPFSGNVLLETSAMESNRTGSNLSSSYGRLLDGRLLTLLDTEGRAIVWNLVDGKEIASLQVEAMPDLIGLHSMILADKVFLLPMRRAEPNEAGSTSQLHTRQGNDHEPADAVFAISLGDGKLVWKKMFEEPWGCTVHQPDETPVLLLTRARSLFPNPRVRLRKLDFLALDVDDGKEVASLMDKDVPSTTNELETRTRLLPGQPIAMIDIGLEKLQLTFEEK